MYSPPTTHRILDLMKQEDEVKMFIIEIRILFWGQQNCVVYSQALDDLSNPGTQRTASKSPSLSLALFCTHRHTQTHSFLPQLQEKIWLQNICHNSFLELSSRSKRFCDCFKYIFSWLLWAIRSYIRRLYKYRIIRVQPKPGRHPSHTFVLWFKFLHLRQGLIKG